VVDNPEVGEMGMGVVETLTLKCLITVRGLVITVASLVMSQLIVRIRVASVGGPITK
jgi:hypothetical protein